MIILRGNDITLRWTITKCLDGSEVPEDFSGADLSVFILSYYDRVRFNALVEGNVITVSIPGNTQKNGKIGIEAVWSKNNGKNWSRAKQVDVLEITDDPKRVTHCSGATVDNHVVELANKLVGSVGYDGITPEIINGNWWIGSVDTGISATGPQGDAFTFEDFTPEQIKMLKQPAVDASKEVAELESAISLNEQVRIQAEQNRAQAEEDRSLSEQGRVDNESTRVANEESRTQSETMRGRAETDRSSAEQLRVHGEEKRVAEEQKRVNAEQSRETAEQDRVTASDKAVQECKAAATNATEQGDYAKTQGDTAKAAAEQAIDAKMALFIDMWNSACGTYGRYNKETKFFELNGLTDITYEQAIDIYAFGQTRLGVYDARSYQYNLTSRTNLYKNKRSFSAQASGENSVRWSSIFSYSKYEVLRLQDDYGSVVCSPNLYDNLHMFYFLLKLKRIIGIIDISKIDSAAQVIVSNCPLLEEVKIKGFNRGIAEFNSNMSINNDSILYLLSNAINTTESTLKMHPDVYARVTADEAIVAKALEKNIILASA